MTDFQLLTVMIGFGSLVTAIIFGLLTVVIGMLNLTKRSRPPLSLAAKEVYFFV